MSLTPAQLAEFDQMVAGHAQRLDQLVASFYSNPFIHTDVERIGTLALMLTRERYRLAWVSARQRADAVHQALVEADEERDHLRAQLRDRDEATR